MLKRILIGLILGLVVVSVSWAVVPEHFNVQGRLGDENGPLAEREVLITQSTDKVVLGQATTDSNGVFNAQVDATIISADLVNFPETLEIDIYIDDTNGNPLVDNQAIKSVPYSFLAENLTPGDKTINGTLTVTGDLNVEGDTNLGGKTTVNDIDILGDIYQNGQPFTPGEVAGDFVKKSGDTMTGTLKIGENQPFPSTALQIKAADKGVDGFGNNIGLQGLSYKIGVKGVLVGGNNVEEAVGYLGRKHEDNGISYYYGVEGEVANLTKGKGYGVYGFASGVAARAGVLGKLDSDKSKGSAGVVGTVGEPVNDDYPSYYSSGVFGYNKDGYGVSGKGKIGAYFESNSKLQGLKAINNKFDWDNPFTSSGVQGEGGLGVLGISNKGVIGVVGLLNEKAEELTKKKGVKGLAVKAGVFGGSDAAYAGVYGIGKPGVIGESKQASGTGVKGHATLNISGFPKVSKGVSGTLSQGIATQGDVTPFCEGVLATRGIDDRGEEYIAGVYGMVNDKLAKDFALFRYGGYFMGGNIGVYSEGTQHGILAKSYSGSGVRGESTKFHGVIGVGGGVQNAGVYGNNPDKGGAGVQGFSSHGTGVRGSTSDGLAGEFIGDVKITGQLISSTIQDLVAENQQLKSKVAALEVKLDEFMAAYQREREIASR